MRAAYYSNTVRNFLLDDNNLILGKLHKGNTDYAQSWNIQTTSWESSIAILKDQLNKIIIEYNPAEKWQVLLEYEIPRFLRRIDVVLIAEDIIFVIEFKFDRKDYELEDQRQVEDYALDLKDFHYESRNRAIIPILLAPLAKNNIDNSDGNLGNDFVKNTIKANLKSLSDKILKAFIKFHIDANEFISINNWENSKYAPTPTIIQAAQALFAGQKVEAISNSGAENLNVTTAYLIDVIEEAKIENKKIICFVTGVPGAGKTLVGLNIVHKKDYIEENLSSIAYFSGNGPLINVLREALTRDEFERRKGINKGEGKLKPKKGTISREIEAKIQNLHKFIKDNLRNKVAPYERIVIFDEAQRCWNADHFYNKTVRNKNRESQPTVPIRKSEAEILFEIMNRHAGYAVIIALVGNGQEINTGEAGIREWGNVLKNNYRDWEIHISPELYSNENGDAKNTLFDRNENELAIYKNNSLHLSVSQRSFKAHNLNEWVNDLLENESTSAKILYEEINPVFPIVLTRSIDKMKAWLKDKMHGTKRIGLVASSGALRLRPYGINTKESIDESYWFLNDETDIRSSFYLELAATEFAIQGLEIDWVGVCWDADLRRVNGKWGFKNFSGTTWENINTDSAKQYLINKYRVLLTRAREGMVIWVPEGDNNDPTRLSEMYDPIYEYLKSCGVKEI